MAVRFAYAPTMAGAFVLLAALGGAVAACDAASAPRESASPPGTPTSQGAEPSQPLLDAVRRDGSVRVIVTLAVPHTPEAELSAEAGRRQRAAIATAQDKLLDDLAPHRVRVTARYERLPQIALEVDEPALRRLSASPLAAAVQPDKAE